MSLTKTLFGTTVIVPERKERGWGAQVTNILDKLIDSANLWATLSGSTVVPAFSVASSTLSAGGVLTPSAVIHRVQGNGGAVTLDTTTPIAAGVSGRPLFLVGAHAANTVTIQDGGNVDLETDIELALGEGILLIYNATTSKWEEVARSNVSDFRNNLALRLYEARANGANKVTLGVPANLAGDYSFTLPAALPVANTRVLIISAAGQVSLVTDGSPGQVLTTDGVGGYSFTSGSGATLQLAYDAGPNIILDTDPIGLAQANDASVLVIDKTGLAGGVVVDLENDGTGKALYVKQDGVVGAGGVVHIDVTVNQATVPCFTIDKTATGAGVLVLLNNDGTGQTLSLDLSANAGGILVTKTGAGAGICIDVANSGTGLALNILNSANAGGVLITKTGAGAGIPLAVDNRGSGIAVDIAQTVTAALALQVSSNQNNDVVQINKTATGAGEAVAIADAGTGISLQITKTGDGAGIAIDKTATGAGACIAIDNDGTGVGINIIQDGAERCLQLTQNGNAQAMTIDQTQNQRCLRIVKTGAAAGICVEIEDDGTGGCLFLNQDGDQVALTIDMAAALVNAGIQITHNNGGDVNDIRGTSGLWNITNKGHVRSSRLSMTRSARTIATGAIEISQGGWVILTGEGAAADDLDNITSNSNDPVVDGTILILRAATDTETITVRDTGGGTGNIRLNAAANRSLDNIKDTLMLVFDSVQNVWLEIGFSSNGA